MLLADSSTGWKLPSKNCALEGVYARFFPLNRLWQKFGKMAERREKRRTRVPNRAPTKEWVTLRLSQEVAQFFNALREWVKTHAA
ncbi:hypothetical protein FACS189475_07490 [Betaproteobacteria bacterium]|nr:hypothetical protein FACS189475_07490 [Betaproteobacteria bacterium]